MKKNVTNLGLYAVAMLFSSALFTQCTKAKYNDDVTKGDPPPVPGGFVNSSEIAKANLVGYWDFNGNTKDNISGVTATPTNIGYATGIKGQAMQGAVNGYAIAAPSTAVKSMGSFTISYWVKSPVNSGGVAGMVGFADNANFWGNINTFFENGGNADLMRFKTIFASNGVSFDFGVQEFNGRWNVWNQFILSYDGVETFKIIVNGNTVKTGTRTGLGPIKFINFGQIVFGCVHFMTTPSLTTGSTAQPWANFLTGQLDEVRIYNKSLSDVEANALFQLEKQGR